MYHLEHFLIIRFSILPSLPDLVQPLEPLGIILAVQVFAFFSWASLLSKRSTRFKLRFTALSYSDNTTENSEFRLLTAEGPILLQVFPYSFLMRSQYRAFLFLGIKKWPWKQNCWKHFPIVRICLTNFSQMKSLWMISQIAMNLSKGSGWERSLFLKWSSRSSEVLEPAILIMHNGEHIVHRLIPK